MEDYKSWCNNTAADATLPRMGFPYDPDIDECWVVEIGPTEFVRTFTPVYETPIVER